MRRLLIETGFVVAIWTVAVVVLVVLGRRTQAREPATLIPNLVVLFTRLLRDPTVPRRAELWIGFAVAWFASPLDLVPEFIPIVGPLDDAIIAVLVLRYVLRRTSERPLRAVARRPVNARSDRAPGDRAEEEGGAHR